jgi:uncharacterized protein YjbJ (UPF0337 family)
MNRDRLEGHWKQMKGRAPKEAGRWTAAEPDGKPLERESACARTHKAFGIRDAEARRQIRELPSR